MDEITLGKIMDKLSSKKLSPDQYYTLYCLSTKTIPKIIDIYSYFPALEEAGWIDSSKQLTVKSVKLIREVDSMFLRETVIKSRVENPRDMISKYLDIWPQFKLPSGKYARVAPGNLLPAFTWFFKNYDYSWDIVLKATARYEYEYRVNGYKYMRNSQYFIRKQAADKSWESDLANYCDKVVNNIEDEGETDYFPEKVV